MKENKSILNLLPRLLVVFGVLFFIAGAMTWENMGWRAAYSSIQPGMDMASVNARFKSLDPPPCQCSYSRGGFWEREAYAHLVVTGPNRWKYVFYIGTNGKVVDKKKWWG